MDAAQTEFNEVEKTGGSKTVTLSVDQMPTHSHTADWASGGDGKPAKWTRKDANAVWGWDMVTGSTGGGGPHPNLPPFITTYLWKRIS